VKLRIWRGLSLKKGIAVTINYLFYSRFLLGIVCVSIIDTSQPYEGQSICLRPSKTCVSANYTYIYINWQVHQVIPVYTYSQPIYKSRMETSSILDYNSYSVDWVYALNSDFKLFCESFWQVRCAEALESCVDKLLSSTCQPKLPQKSAINCSRYIKTCCIYYPSLCFDLWLAFITTRLRCCVVLVSPFGNERQGSGNSAAALNRQAI
jgi:hypothetical protein